MIKVFNELKRRNVFRVAAMYAVVAWLLMQLATQLEDSLNLPAWFDTMITAVVLLGFPIALILAWAFEMTPQGVKRTEAIAANEGTTEERGSKPIVAFLASLAVIALGSAYLWTSTSPSVDESVPVVDSSVPPEKDRPPSIAVLPFDDFSQAKDQEYFANGISEELLNVLARIDGLRVASRTSAFSFQGSGADTSTIAKALDVGHIVEGSIRKSGTTLRITAQLIDTSNDQHMWSETYDRPLTAENLFEIQDEIAKAIVSELRGRLLINTQDTVSRTESLEAYQLYLRARENMAKRLPATLNAAVAGFEQVIELDENFAPAYAGLADTHLLRPGYANVDKVNALSQARGYIERALHLAPNSAEALTASALMALEEGKFSESIDFATKAIEANPNYVPAYHRRGGAYAALGQNIKAIGDFEKAAKLDPLSAVILTNLGGLQTALGDDEAAQATHEKNILFNSDSEFGYSGLASVKLNNADYHGAHSLLKDAQVLNRESESVNQMLNAIYTSTGFFDRALALRVGPIEKSLTLMASGDLDAARNLLVTDSNIPNVVQFFLGDTKKAYPSFRRWVNVSDSMSQPIRSNSVFLLVMSASVFQHESDPDAQPLIDKLTAYFENKSPADLHNFELEAAGFLYMLRGEPEKAYPWFDRYLDLGFARAGVENFVFPGMEELGDHPQWLDIQKRYEENAMNHRERIQSQLDKPKQNWL